MRGMAPLAVELPPDGVAVTVREYVEPITERRAVPPTTIAPVPEVIENVAASVPAID